MLPIHHGFQGSLNGVGGISNLREDLPALKPFEPEQLGASSGEEDRGEHTFSVCSASEFVCLRGREEKHECCCLKTNSLLSIIKTKMLLWSGRPVSFEPPLWNPGLAKQGQEGAPPWPGEGSGQAQCPSLAAPCPPSIGHPWSCRAQARVRESSRESIFLEVLEVLMGLEWLGWREVL